MPGIPHPSPHIPPTHAHAGTTTRHAFQWTHLRRAEGSEPVPQARKELSRPHPPVQRSANEQKIGFRVDFHVSNWAHSIATKLASSSTPAANRVQCGLILRFFPCAFGLFLFHLFRVG